MSASANKIISHGSIYLVGNLLRYSVSFIMLPIYTRMLTPADYGVVELLSMLVDFTAIILGLQIGQAIFRFYIDTDNLKEKHSVISTSLLMLVLLNGLGVLLLWSFSAPLSSHLLGGLENRDLLMLFSLSLLFQPLIEIPMTFIRAQQKPWMFVSFSLLKLILQLSLNVYFVVVQDMHVEGVVISTVIAGGIMSLLLTTYCLRITGLNFSISRARTIVAFSYPLVMASLLSFYVTFGDRFFLQYFGGLEQVGVYALGYKFGFLLSFLATGPFLSIWDSEKYLVMRRPDAKAVYQKTFEMLTYLTLLIVVLISIFSKNLLMIMSDPSFWGAASIIPIILMAYFFQGWTAYCNLGILVEKKTIIITKSSILAALIITVGYILLIPSYGAVGAAWATFFAFAIRFVYIYFQAKQLYDMELPWQKIMLVFPPALLAIVLSQFTSEYIPYAIFTNISIICGLVAIYIFMPFLPIDQRLVLKRVAVRPWRIGSEIRGMLKTGCM